MVQEIKDTPLLSDLPAAKVKNTFSVFYVIMEINTNEPVRKYVLR